MRRPVFTMPVDKGLAIRGQIVRGPTIRVQLTSGQNKRRPGLLCQVVQMFVFHFPGMWQCSVPRKTRFWSHFGIDLF